LGVTEIAVAIAHCATRRRRKCRRDIHVVTL